jgi:hypothetical protein
MTLQAAQAVQLDVTSCEAALWTTPSNASAEMQDQGQGGASHRL